MFNHWHTEPLLLGSLLLSAWLYLLAVGPFRDLLARARPPTPPFPRSRAATFLAGLATVYAAVGSPLDQIGESLLFSAHMLQHMLLVYVAAPLILLGLPPWLLDSLLSPPHVRRALRFLTHPVFAATAAALLLTAWHAPDLYEAALLNRTLHALEHACFFFPALLVWWPILSTATELPPLTHGLRILYAFALMVVQLPLFLFLIFSDAPLYPTYALAPRLFDLTPLEDQFLAALLMKVANELVCLTIMAHSFYRWYNAESAPAPSEPPQIALKTPAP